MSKYVRGETFGPFVVLDCFEGGMGQVYRVFHEGWGMELALKVVKGVFASNQQVRSWFLLEAETWAELGLHPYVATCFYTNRLFRGEIGVVSEFVSGGSVLEAIQTGVLYSLGDETAVSRILEIAAQAAVGLAWAHQKHVVHQDVKPGNLLLDGDGTVKVTDFGLARSLDRLGQAAVAGNTPAYASPEQISGSTVSKETDVWSWALTVLHLFVGRISWQHGAVGAAALMEYCNTNRRIPGRPQMPKEVVSVLQDCLRHKPADRPGNLADLADRLSQIHDDLFGEPLILAGIENETFASDSLNNRAVSLLQVDRIEDARVKLMKALEGAPYHLEATYNFGLVVGRHSSERLNNVAANLDSLDSHPAHRWRKEKLVTLALAAEGRRKEALQRLHSASAMALSPAEAKDLGFTRQLVDLAAHQIPYVLSPPRPAGEIGMEEQRFRRLIPKAQSACREGRIEEAKRYLLMLGDLPDFHHHPSVVYLRRVLSGR